MKAELERAIRDVVIANCILPRKDVVDACGHVSPRAERELAGQRPAW